MGFGDFLKTVGKKAAEAAGEKAGGVYSDLKAAAEDKKMYSNRYRDMTDSELREEYEEVRKLSYNARNQGRIQALKEELNARGYGSSD